MSQEEMERVSGGRAVWRTYFTVDDADHALTRVRALGGTVIHEPVAIGTDGRLAAAEDPSGAAFTMWEPWDHFRGAAFWRARCPGVG
jgi:predicted enzyme related to lactoylglutathione lyase